MFDSIWINAHLVTMTNNDDYDIIKNGAMGIKDKKICMLGKMSELPDTPENLANTVYDADGQYLTPGFIDCHTHLVYGGDRAEEFEQRLNGVSYEEIAKAGGGIISTVTATREIDEETLFQQSIKRVRIMMKGGVTSFEIKSGYGLNTQTEAKMLRVATRIRDEFDLKIQRTFLGVHALPPEFKDKPDDYITYIIDDMMPTLVSENLIDAVDGFCENIGFSTKQMERVFEKAKELNLPVKLHAEQLSNQQGAKLASKYKALSADHLEYLDENGVKAMADSNMVAVLLPSAFYYLRETKKPPIDLFRKYNVEMALATDCNPGSSPITSMPLIMNMACTLFHMTPFETLKAVTCNAGKALGWQDELGTLEIGKRADFALFNVENLSEISYQIGSTACSGIVLDSQYLRLPD